MDADLFSPCHHLPANAALAEDTPLRPTASKSEQWGSSCFFFLRLTEAESVPDAPTGATSVVELQGKVNLGPKYSCCSIRCFFFQLLAGLHERMRELRFCFFCKDVFEYHVSHF